jgi:diacylglycerol O-acyltransferase-1
MAATTTTMKENQKPTLASTGELNNSNGSVQLESSNTGTQTQSINGTGEHTKASETLQLTRPEARPRTHSISGSKHAQAAARKYKHAFAVHSKNRTSCLSRDTTENVSMQGFKNLAFAVLACSILRLMIENFKRYGIRVTISSNGPSRSDLIYGTILYVSVPCHLFVAYGIERLAAWYAQGAVGRVKKSEARDYDKQLEFERKRLKSLWWIIAVLHALNATFNLLVSTTVVYCYIHNPGIGTIHEMHAVIVWLKVCSYAFTNRDIRHAFLKPDPTGQTIPALYKTCPYPQNITISNLCYFWWAPTLIYQPAYPRTDKIRWTFVAKRVCETILACFIIWIASAQYAVPLLQNSLTDISELKVINLLERVLKLSTISVICWLAGFYALFQASLNALAEVMRFGDREFYGDWWNCSDVRSYWTSWNKPVSQFMKRHVYAPMVGRGMPPTLAQIVTFTFSAVLHEILVGIPTHNVLGLAFVGMMLQLPLIFLTDIFRKREGYWPKLMGNLTFWCTFCLVGQPVAALGYYFAWQAKYGQHRPEYPVLWPSGEKAG